MKDNKKNILLSSIAVFVLIAIVAGATFAFFASTQDINANLPANITTASKTYTFIASADGEINFYLSATDMLESNVSENYITADNGLINVEIASANDDEITRCTYDIAWVWDSDNKYTTPDVELPYTKDDKTYPYELSVSVDGKEEKDLSTFTLDSSNSFVIAAGLTSIATSTTPIIDSHKIEVKAYNIPIDQQNLFNKNFNAHMEVRNVNCDVTNGTITKLKNGTFYSALSNDVNGTTDFTDTDSTAYSGAIINENGLRFEGKNPNNYVSFNDELWRIIGVFDEKTHGRAGEQLVKLIRAEALPGYYQWDNKGEKGLNNWNNASLKTTLNINYYNNSTISACSNSSNSSCTSTTVIGEGIKSDATRNMIQPIQWKIGGHNINSTTVSKIYENERGTELPNSEGATAATIEELSIGLMYLSDYGYAVQASDCARTEIIHSYAEKTVKCHTENWLWNSSFDQWTLTPNSDASSYSWLVVRSGYVNDWYVNYSYSIIPVLHLKQNVAITGGIGTKINPYIITM